MTTATKKRGRPRKNPVATPTGTAKMQEIKPTINASTKKKIAAGLMFGAVLALFNHFLKKA